MLNIRELIEANDGVTEDILELLLDDIGLFNAAVFRALTRFIETLDTTDGKLSNSGKNKEKLIKIYEFVYNELKKSKYVKNIDKILPEFKKYNGNYLSLAEEVNGVTLAASKITRFQKLAVDRALSEMAGTGLISSLVDPIRQTLFDAIQYREPASKVADTLYKRVYGDPQISSDTKKFFERRIIQITKDALNQSQGIIQQGIATAYGLKDLAYVGSIITTTRPQCERWVKKGVILQKDLAEEIREAYDSGQGMYPNTNINNFHQKRGGFNCRHKTIPVKNSAKLQKRLIRLKVIGEQALKAAS